MKINFTTVSTILFLISIPMAFYIFSYNESLFQFFLKYNNFILEWVEENFITLTISSCFIVFISIILNIPGGSLRAVIAGYIFGVMIGGLIVIIITTFSSLILFLFYRNNIFIYKKEFDYHVLNKFKKFIHQNEIFLLLAIRILPIIPFFVQNIIIANLKISIFRYLYTTLLGIIPTNLIYIMIGSEIKNITDIENINIFSILINNNIFLSLIFLLIFYFIISNLLFLKKSK